MNIYSFLLNQLPHHIFNFGVSYYNWRAYKKRYGGKYKEYLLHYNKNRGIPLKKLQEIQADEFRKLVEYAISHSTFYKNLYQNLQFDLGDIKNIEHLPIVGKEDLRSNINDVYTIGLEEATIGKTGGTTGKSLVVRSTLDCGQKRFALLDNFRSEHGYSLGKRTAWFSGKSILNSRDLKKNRFWKTDYLYNVRYYSTFHINTKNLRFYVDNLLTYKPEFLVGFPSTMFDIAKEGLKLNKKFPKGVVKTIFPTAETLTDPMRNVIESFFNCKAYDQYASSEGAPFIFECKCGKKHLELQSGVFEVLDDDNTPASKGRLVVTSFTTYGTPLIRYDIGDTIELDLEGSCTCGNNNPLVKALHGRIDDFIYSEETGKINLGNVSNCTKGVNGIIQFQVIQDAIDQVEILIIKDSSVFTQKDESCFINNLRERLGQRMEINIQYVANIDNAASGKFRLIRNNIKHLL